MKNVQVNSTYVLDPLTGVTPSDGDGSTGSGSGILYNTTGQNTDGAMTQKATTDELELRAPLDSPALTGLPTAPTAPLNTNNTQLATTAYVDRGLSGVSQSAILVTYAQLKALVNSSGLAQGQRYILTDFANIIGVRDVILAPYGDKLIYGALEPLLLTARSKNELELIAQSCIYTDERGEYQLYNYLADVYSEPHTGTLYSRSNSTTKVSTPFDYRLALWRRWKDSSGFYMANSDVLRNGDFLDLPPFDIANTTSVQILGYGSIVAQGYISDVYISENSGLYLDSAPGTGVTGIYADKSANVSLRVRPGAGLQKLSVSASFVDIEIAQNAVVRTTTIEDSQATNFVVKGQVDNLHVESSKIYSLLVNQSGYIYGMFVSQNCEVQVVVDGGLNGLDMRGSTLSGTVGANNYVSASIRNSQISLDPVAYFYQVVFDLCSGLDTKLVQSSSFWVLNKELTFGSGGTVSASFGQIPEYVAGYDGSQYIPLPTGAAGVVSVIVYDAENDATRTLYPSSYTFANGALQIDAIASVAAMDRVTGIYTTLAATGTGTGGTGGTTSGVTPAELETVRTTVVVKPTVVSNYTLDLTDAGALSPVDMVGQITVPAGVFPVGAVLELVSLSTSVYEVLADVGVTILAATGNKSVGQGMPMRLVMLSSDNWLLTGGGL